MSEVKPTLQGHSTGTIMSIQRSHWNSVTRKPVLRLSKHEWRILQRNMGKML